MPQTGKGTGCKQKTQRQVSFPSTVFSPLFAHPPSLHQVKAADGFAKRIHTPPGPSVRLMTGQALCYMTQVTL